MYIKGVVRNREGEGVEVGRGRGEGQGGEREGRRTRRGEGQGGERDREGGGTVTVSSWWCWGGAGHSSPFFGGGHGLLSLFVLLHWVCSSLLVGGPSSLFVSLHCLSIIIVIVGSASLLWLHGHGCVFMLCPLLSSSITVFIHLVAMLLTATWHLDSQQWGARWLFTDLGG